MKYRLIAGTINWYEPEDGWTNVHLDISPRQIWHGPLGIAVLPDVVLDISDQDAVHGKFRQGMFDAARFSHVLEHMSSERGEQALKNLAWLLAPDAILDVEVPDFDRIAEAWLAHKLTGPDLQQWVYGEDLGEPGDVHRAAWNEQLLRDALESAGFWVGIREETGLAVRFVVKRERP